MPILTHVATDVPQTQGCNTYVHHLKTYRASFQKYKLMPNEICQHTDKIQYSISLFLLNCKEEWSLYSCNADFGPARSSELQVSCVVMGVGEVMQEDWGTSVRW